MGGSSTDGRPAFAQCFTHAPRAPGRCAKPSPARFHAPFTQHIHALGRVMPWRPADAQASATASGLRSNCANCAQKVRSSVRTVGTHSGAYRQQVRAEVRTFGSHPLTRTWCEPGGQPVIKSYGCQALVSIVVYTKRRGSDWQPWKIAAHCLEAITVNVLRHWGTTLQTSTPRLFSYIHSYHRKGEGYAINGSSSCGRRACCASAWP